MMTASSTESEALDGLAVPLEGDGGEEAGEDGGHGEEGAEDVVGHLSEAGPLGCHGLQLKQSIE